jgi:transposase
MKERITHQDGVAAWAAAANQSRVRPAAIKLGVDVHSRLYVVVAQYDHAQPRPARRFLPEEFVPWVRTLLAAGHTVHVVYEACGFGFGLCRELEAAGARCCVIAPQKLDERRTGVKTDPRDALTLCQRLSRYVDGNVHELAVVRVPSESEERDRHVHRQREVLVRHRCKLEAVGRGMLVSHGLPAPSHWHREQTWARLCKVLPEWMPLLLAHLRPVLLALEERLAALTGELEAAAPAAIPRGIGKLTTVVLSREVCDWHRFTNRRQVASYTGLCPGEHSSGGKRVQGSVTKRGN